MHIQMVCPKCKSFNRDVDDKCWKCGREITEEEKIKAVENENREQERLTLEQEERNRSLLKEARTSGDWSNLSDELITEESKKIILTTSYTLASLEVEKEINIITAEIAYGMNIFRDIFAGVRDVVGGNSKAVQKVLRDSRNAVLAELRKEAFIIGADAVIAVNLNYQEFSGGGKLGMIMLIASGTAVNAKPRVSI